MKNKNVTTWLKNPLLEGFFTIRLNICQTLMLEDLGDKICWWQFWDVSRFCRQYALSIYINNDHQCSKSVINIKSSKYPVQTILKCFILENFVVVSIQNGYFSIKNDVQKNVQKWFIAWIIGFIRGCFQWAAWALFLSN